MQTLQRIRFPRKSSTGALCFAHTSTALLDQGGPQPCYRFALGQTLSSSSYLNSYYEFLQRCHGLSRNHAFRLALAGDFEVTVWSARFGAEPQVVWRETLSGCVPSEPVLAPIPRFEPGEPNQRLYFTLTALSEGAFFGGDVATDHEPRPVRLAVVLCTFRREDYLRATVSGLLADADLAGRLSAVVVVDNGRTLAPEEFDDPRVTVIANRNCGGAGGFSRGMIEVLERDLGSHILLMDDDIECDSEAVLRTISFYEHSDQPVALAGAMLDLQKPHQHFEAGALYGRGTDVPGEAPLKILGLGRGLCLEQAGALNTLLLDERADYGAWWYFAFPARYAAKGGLALPFFIIGDDIEFGLRLTRKMGVRILPMPGVGVWHEPFYSKISCAKRYFFVRNMLVIDALYGESSYLDIVRALVAEVEIDLCKFNYGMVLMLLRGFEDFLRGPGLFTHTDPEALIESLLAEAKALDDNTKPFTPQETWGFEQTPKVGILRTLVRRLTLGGHLLHRNLLRCDPMHVSIMGQWRNNFLCSRALFLHHDAAFSYARDIDCARGRELALRFAKDLWSGREAWKRARDAWRREAARLSSAEFWKEYCNAPGQRR